VIEEAALPDTLSWTRDEPHSNSKAIAYAALFRAWGEKYLNADPCQQAERIGLRCRSSRGGLDELRRLNRPAVLHMRDDRGREFLACLTALDDKSATFAFGTDETRVALAALASQWSGHYTALWRAPPDLQGTLLPGASGPAVAWLSRQLAVAERREPDTSDASVFDAAMVRRVKEFQLAQGLIPDGAVGAQTLMHLSSAADRSAPRLTHSSGEK
jgi:general secretion pathway protein A